MRAICFYFQVHQPFRLRKYRFFDIDYNHYYFDDYANRTIMRKVAEKCYLPTNQLMLDLINQHYPHFKISYSISGTALDQFEMYAPDVLESFKRLAATGCVEFIAETYSHSLSALKDKEEFFSQVKQQTEKIKQHFGQTPTTFRNTELIYADFIGEMVAEMGYKQMLTEGAKHIMGWRSPNFLYCNANNPKLKVLLKNYQLSDDIAFRFSNKAWESWPLTTDKYVGWLNEIDQREEVVNLFMDYETFGEHQWADSGIFDFMKHLPAAVLSQSNFTFNTPSDVASNLQPVSPIHIPFPISWADEERDLTAWLGNELQNEAFDKLYALKDIVKRCNDEDLKRDWKYLQTSDHFYYMCTKWFSDGDVHKYFNPYDTPYDAFINFMNVLSDFILRLEISSADSDDDVVIEEAKAVVKKIEKKAAAPTKESKKTVVVKQNPIVKKIATSKKSVVKVTPAKKAVKAKVPAKKIAAKKVTVKKVVKPIVKKVVAKKVIAKKPVIKKAPIKKVTAKKIVVKKAAVKKVVAKKPVVKKATSKKVLVKKVVAKKAPIKKVVVKKPILKKVTTKKLVKPIIKKAAVKKVVKKVPAKKLIKPIAKKVVIKKVVKKQVAKKTIVKAIPKKTVAKKIVKKTGKKK